MEASSPQHVPPAGQARAPSTCHSPWPARVRGGRSLCRRSQLAAQHVLASGWLRTDQTCLGLPAKPSAPAGSQPSPGGVSLLCQADPEHPWQTPEAVPSQLQPGSASTTAQPHATSKANTGSQSLEGRLSSEHCLPQNKHCLANKTLCFLPTPRGALGSGPQQSPLPAVRQGHTIPSLGLGFPV